MYSFSGTQQGMIYKVLFLFDSKSLKLLLHVDFCFHLFDYDKKKIDLEMFTVIFSTIHGFSSDCFHFG